MTRNLCADKLFIALCNESELDENPELFISQVLGQLRQKAEGRRANLETIIREKSKK